jgi:hypothetical protein
MEKERRNPIFYKDASEMDKPLSELMEELRSDVANVRGKLWDIKQSFGWNDRIEHIEGGLSCILMAMFATMEEWQAFEKKRAAKPQPNEPIK